MCFQQESSQGCRRSNGEPGVARLYALDTSSAPMTGAIEVTKFRHPLGDLVQVAEQPEDDFITFCLVRNGIRQ